MEVNSKRRAEYPLIHLTIKLLRIIRFWNKSPGQGISTFGVVLVALYPIVWLIPSWLFLATSQDNIKLWIKGANEQIVFSIAFFRILFFAIHFQRWEQLFYDLQNAYSSVIDSPSIEIKKIVDHVTKSTHNLTKYYCTIVNFNCAWYGIFRMLFIGVKYVMSSSDDVALSTPIEANYIIPGYRTNFWVWLPLNFTLNVMLELHGLAMVFVECFTWNLVYATSCMLRILQIQANELLEQSQSEKEWKMELKKFVTLHDSVLRSAGTLEDILSGQMLLLYISTVFVQCLSMVVLSLPIDEVYLLPTTVASFSYCIFQTFSFSYLGTELIEQSGTVADAIFHSKWYDQDVKKWKDLCFVMLRAKKPVTLTAAKLFVVTRDSFTQVIKQAYAIFTLMSQFLDDTVN